MRSFRLLFLRRLIAACLAVSLGFFSAESLTAEVHDGDATHAELVQADGVREHRVAHRAALVAEAAPDGHPAASTTFRRTAGPGAPGGAVAFAHGTPANAASVMGHPHDGPSHGPNAPEHAGHACHCGHAHVAPLPMVEAALCPAFGTRVPVPVAEPVVLFSRAAAPALRPPIG